MHALLKQQLHSLGLDDDRMISEAEWHELKKILGKTYAESDSARVQWKEAYDALREDMEGSFEQLRQSSANIISNERDKLNSIVRSLSEGLCALNENGCLLFMNPEAEALTGWNEADVRGQLFLDWLIPSADEETTTEKVVNLLRAGGSIRQEETFFLHKGGQPLIVSYNVDPIMQQNTFVGAVVAFRDIRDFKEAEENRERQLQETLLLNRVIAATTSTLEQTAVLSNICEELATFLNLPHAAFALLNEKQDHLTIVAEYLGEGQISALDEIIPLANNRVTQQVLQTRKPVFVADAQNDPRQQSVQALARRRGTRSILVVPLLVREQVLGTLGLNTVDGREFEEREIQLVQNVASAVTQALKNAELYTAIQQELAERGAAEQALAQARDKAQESSRLKSELVAKVSHELRTPLTAILGFTEMLQLEIYGEVNQEQKEVLSNVLQSTDGLVVLVNDLLDVAQIEAGKLTISNLPFEPRKLLERIESTMSVLAEARGLTLCSEVDTEIPLKLLGDEERIHQVLVNLVSNAIKFTAAGSVLVKLNLVDNSHWAFSVKDTGKGIPKGMHKAIFDQFQQVRFTPTREEGGIGLGLAIVKQLVEMMGGHIQLDSEVGVGSLFVITLPLQLPLDTVNNGEGVVHNL